MFTLSGFLPHPIVGWPYPASPRNPSVSARGLAKTRPQDTKATAGGSQRSLPPPLPCHVPQGMQGSQVSSLDPGLGEDRPCAVWLQASSAVSELAIDAG